MAGRMVVTFLCLAPPFLSAFIIDPSTAIEKNQDYWLAKSKEELKIALSAETQPIVREAKNVILFIGDGMGVSTVTAARILGGQLENVNGERHKLAWETFPHVAFSKTYNVDHQVADSASTATAYLCGVKTNSYTLGVDARTTFDDCSSHTASREVTSILDWCKAAGKSTGVVTNTRVTHATPAAAYAHSVQREWEGQVPYSQLQQGCIDIAQQLVYDNADINVVMGGGRKYFLPRGYYDHEEKKNLYGRNDSLHLVQAWRSYHSSRSHKYAAIWNLTDFNKVDASNTDYLLGLFNADHLHYNEDRDNDVAGEPSLAQMTEKAIRILSKNPSGYFLLVEGGQIDLAHHDGMANRALLETVALSDAVAVAKSLTSVSDTLVIVTADHSHTMVIAGYAGRNSFISGLSEDKDGEFLGNDNMPYTTLLYATGPGAIDALRTSGPGRRLVTQENATSLNYRQQAIIPMDTETHGGEDVAIYARGPMSHLFHGVHEQSYIAHVMAYAACVGDFTDDCARNLQG